MRGVFGRVEGRQLVAERKVVAMRFDERADVVTFEGNLDVPSFGRPYAALDKRRQQGGIRLEF